jgi:cation/acetate symporter
LSKLNGLHTELGFTPYTDGSKSMVDVFFITAALMIGTAGLPHVIVRFFTVPKVKDARTSAGYALILIAVLYTTAPAVAAFARTNLINTVSEKEYKTLPDWFKKWEDTGLLAWVDKNNDGKVQYLGPKKASDDPKNGNKAIVGKPKVKKGTGKHGEILWANENDSSNKNELYIDRDIMVLANPEIAKLPNWVIALVAAGGLAAALSTAAGLLLVISTSVAHDLIKMQINPNLSEKGELMWARIAAIGAVTTAGLFGIYPPDYVAAVVALAFGLAASSFFPAIILGIFNKRMNKEGVIAGMIIGLGFTLFYIVMYKFMYPAKENWWFGISPEGIGTLGMLVNFAVSLVVSAVTPPPPDDVQELVENIRYPRGAGEAVAH